MPQALPMIAMTAANAAGKGAGAQQRVTSGVSAPPAMGGMGGGLLTPMMLQQLLNRMPGMGGNNAIPPIQSGMPGGITGNSISSFGSGLLSF